jgi:hypothetical protein
MLIPRINKMVKMMISQRALLGMNDPPQRNPALAPDVVTASQKSTEALAKWFFCHPERSEGS